MALMQCAWIGLTCTAGTNMVVEARDARILTNRHDRLSGGASDPVLMLVCLRFRHAQLLVGWVLPLWHYVTCVVWVKIITWSSIQPLYSIDSEQQISKAAMSCSLSAHADAGTRYLQKATSAILETAVMHGNLEEGQFS